MGFLIYYFVLILNPMGRILVCWTSFRNNVEILCHPICNQLYQRNEPTPTLSKGKELLHVVYIQVYWFGDAEKIEPRGRTGLETLSDCLSVACSLREACRQTRRQCRQGSMFRWGLLNRDSMQSIKFGVCDFSGLGIGEIGELRTSEFWCRTHMCHDAEQKRIFTHDTNVCSGW